MIVGKSCEDKEYHSKLERLLFELTNEYVIGKGGGGKCIGKWLRGMQSTSSQRMTLLLGVAMYRGMQKQLEVQGRMERFWLQVVLIAL